MPETATEGWSELADAVGKLTTLINEMLAEAFEQLTATINGMLAEAFERLTATINEIARAFDIDTPRGRRRWRKRMQIQAHRERVAARVPWWKRAE